MIIAKWTSKGGRWTAYLEQDDQGDFTLREFKHGQPCGASYRPAAYFRQNPPYPVTAADTVATAKAWAILQVANGFDVAMNRVAV